MTARRFGRQYDDITWRPYAAADVARGEIIAMTRLTVALSGLADADVGQVRAALGRDDLCHWQLADGADGDVVLVDVDSVWGHMDWLKANANGRHTVACSRQQELREKGPKLTTPVDAEALASLLKAIESEVDGEDGERAAPAPPRPAAAAVEPASASAPAPAPPASAPVDNVPSAPAATAAAVAAQAQTSPDAAPEPAAEPLPDSVGAWLLAGAEAFSVCGTDGTRLSVDPQADGYVGPTQLKPLQPLLQLPLEAIERDGASASVATGPAQPLSRLLWFTALCAYEGTLAPTLDRQAAYRLNRWPQIEREFPRHFRIATAMMKQAGSLGEIASLANTPEADVADFINAYHAVGYVERDGGDEAAADTGMLSRLRKPFARSAQGS